MQAQVGKHVPPMYVHRVSDSTELQALGVELLDGIDIVRSPAARDNGAARDVGADGVEDLCGHFVDGWYVRGILQRLQVTDKLNLQDEESGDESQAQDFTHNQGPDGLERVRVLDFQVHIRVFPVVVRPAPRGKLPLEEVVALLVPIRAEHERG